VGLLKSRKEAAGELKRYVDAVEHADLDDVEDDEFLDSDGVDAEVTLSIEALQAQVAARNARINAAMAAAASGRTDANPERHSRMLGELLVGRGVVTAEQLVQALDAAAEAGQRLGEFLVSKRVLTERDLATVLAEQFGLEVVDLRHEFPDPTSVVALPEAHAREWGALVLRRTDFGFDVVVADPSDTSIAERLREVLRQPAKLYVGSAGEIDRAMDVAYRTTANVELSVPTSYDAQGGFLVDIGSAVAATVP